MARKIHWSLTDSQSTSLTSNRICFSNITFSLKSTIKKGVYPVDMTHNDFEFEPDLVNPIRDFFQEVNDSVIKLLDERRGSLQMQKQT